MGVPRRSYAAQRSVSEAARRKAIAIGRITTLPDGTIDRDRSDSEWGAQTDPAKQHGQQARLMAFEPVAGTTRAAVATKPVPRVSFSLAPGWTSPSSARSMRGAAPARLRLKFSTEGSIVFVGRSVQDDLRNPNRTDVAGHGVRSDLSPTGV